jgi:hypothetical protein
MLLPNENERLLYNDQMKREKRQLIDDKTLGLSKTNPTKTVDEFIQRI